MLRGGRALRRKTVCWGSALHCTSGLDMYRIRARIYAVTGTVNPRLPVPLRTLKLPFKTGAEALKRELKAL